MLSLRPPISTKKTRAASGERTGVNPDDRDGIIIATATAATMTPRSASVIERGWRRR